MPRTKAAGPKAAKPRRRLDSAAARELILDVTEKRLTEAGPSGIRLQEVAADAGVSHPTVLHHFGSREALVKAVISRSLQAINASLVEALTASGGDHVRLEAILENVATALGRSGHARVILWLALEGHSIDGADVRLADVVDATHAVRLSRREKGDRTPRSDTARTVVLAALALIAGSVIGPQLLEKAGLGSGPGVGESFRAWLARVLIAHLDG